MVVHEIIDASPGLPALTAAESAQVEAFKTQLLAKRQAQIDVERQCSCCRGPHLGGGKCPKCVQESAVCPWCGDKSAKEVCRACINAGFGWCKLCRGKREPHEQDPCLECQRAAGMMSAQNFRDVPPVPTGITDGARVYEPVPFATAMNGPPGPTTEIPR